MSTHTEERRRFTRLELTEDAFAVDENGVKLGRVSQAGGGGMQVEALSEAVLCRMPQGARMRLTVVEPTTGTANAMSVEIRHVDGLSVGMEFVGPV